MNQRQIGVAVAVTGLLIGTLGGLVGLQAVGMAAAEETQSADDIEVLAIDDNHDLDDVEAVSTYDSEGVADAELSQLDGELTMATSKSDVGVDDELTPTDARNNFLRIEYDEEFERTLRIHVPRDYQTPYTQSHVGSVTSNHTAEFSPVRGGEYLEVVVDVEEESDIVLPLQKDSSISYRAVEWADTRVEVVTGVSMFGSGDEWRYLDGEELAEDAAYELEGHPDDVAVQYDAERSDPDETWLNAPKGEDDDEGVYWFIREESGEETAYVVATEDESPNVRFKSDATTVDHWYGEARDAMQIPDRITDILDDGLGGIL